MCDVVVAGAVAQCPGRAGHAWAFLGWLAGFRRLGHRVLFVDRIDPSLGDVDTGVAWVRDVMTWAGFGDDYSVRLPGGGSAGRPWPDVLASTRGAVLLNVMGYADDDDLLAGVGCRVFLDLDPGFGQAWTVAGTARPFDGHDVHVTVGLNVGAADCRVPACDLDWLHTLPPVDLDAWAGGAPPVEGSFTTVGAWRGPFAPVEVDGEVHGLRAHAFRALADLPERTGAGFEAALDLDPADHADRERLLAGGWRLADPAVRAGSPGAYRAYVHASLAEFGVAKQVYASLRTGWFSDRSACYLAAGRAVVVTDTGLGAHLPLGEGLLAYGDPAGAVAAVHEVCAAPARHGKAARALAEDLFDARRVAGALLERLP